MPSTGDPAPEAAGAIVLGVSPDPIKAVKKFADKQSLQFRLLADEDHPRSASSTASGSRSSATAARTGVRSGRHS
jgi:peroxiredoxin Q/BCP